MNREAKYSLSKNGCFVIEGYNQSKPFSNFFPGIAGLWGIPMWVFYVNRGQCIASFGIESKDKAIMEFQPANKSYRMTSLQGFRTFIKLRSGKKNYFWEPFQENLVGTQYKRVQKCIISAYDLTLEETNLDLGLKAKVNYFTLPQEPFSALVRGVSIKNIGKRAYDFEIIDGLPQIVPFGLNDSLMKNISRTVEAWMKIGNNHPYAPYYRLNVEVSDTPEVRHIQEGNFFFSFNPQERSNNLLKPIIESREVFGQTCDYSTASAFAQSDFHLNSSQSSSNKTPCAMSYYQSVLKANSTKSIVSLFGYAQSEEQLDQIVNKASNKKFITDKAVENRKIIEDIQNFTLTKSSSDCFDRYCTHTFVDNILRGGLPVSIKTTDGNVTLNVFSRKHGDLERDYNYFILAPTYYSEGNGNYRDVNQNRRNDVWFNPNVKEEHLVNFLNLSQADGYNPLVVRGSSFLVKDKSSCKSLIQKAFDSNDQDKILEFLTQSFQPGELLAYIDKNQIPLKISPKEFLGKLLEICHKQELAEHGEGFWSDHWTYNLDLLESYLAIYPEGWKELLLNKKLFAFYHNTHYILPRDHRFILTKKGVRQYRSVAFEVSETAASNGERSLRTKAGEGAVYSTHLLCKLLCLIANKAASLDPSGVGVEMEAGKPNWYDALNGLPGLVGSSISETLELKRLAIFLLESFKQLKTSDTQAVSLFEELASFLSGLSHLLSLEADPHSYWMKSNDIKEAYRQRIRKGIDGKEKEMTISEIKNFLNRVVDKTNKAFELAKDDKGFLRTYFTHEVEKFEVIDKSQNDATPAVKPLKFLRHNLPQFLEGYVHALRTEQGKERAKNLYEQVRKSPLYDQKLKMYKVNEDLSAESEEIGRTRIFPRGWLENESIWMHMEYKFLLELLRSELYDEFFDNFKNVLIPFSKPEQYGRSILENSSFIVSSAHEDERLHGQGFVARLSGSTAEFLHMWLLMTTGPKPFSLNAEKKLVLNFNPVLPGWLFTKSASVVKYTSHGKKDRDIKLPKNVFTFNFLGSTLVVYHNPKRLDTFSKSKAKIKSIQLKYHNQKKTKALSSANIPSPYAEDVRNHKVQQIDIVLQ